MNKRQPIALNPRHLSGFAATGPTIRSKSGIAVNRRVLRDVKLQPLDIVEQHDGAFVDVLEVPSLRRRRIQVRVDEELRLREIRYHMSAA